MTSTAKKPYVGLGMEGFIARWYAKNTGKDLTEIQKLAAGLAAALPGGDVLEVAPGPGYLAIELAKRGLRVTGLDISHTFVALAAEDARKAGVEVAFHHGNAAGMPFHAESFDLTVCRAAFKNFTEPVQALCEMHRVLRPGGRALIYDLRPDASKADIEAAIRDMKMGWWSRLMTRWTFRHMLLKRAWPRAELERMARETPFGGCTIKEEGIGYEVTLVK
jgi:ubiquinone/menaquinone biosynthesis C-methylase UbiE